MRLLGEGAQRQKHITVLYNHRPFELSSNSPGSNAGDSRIFSAVYFLGPMPMRANGVLQEYQNTK